MDQIRQIRDELSKHAQETQSENKHSHTQREPFKVPLKLRNECPFFNPSLLSDHQENRAQFRKLEAIRQDIVGQKKARSPNPMLIPHSVFGSSLRMLQSTGKMSEIDPEILKLPAYINWAEEGKTTRIKYQGKCRSCYAFSGLAAVESAILIK